MCVFVCVRACVFIGYDQSTKVLFRSFTQFG